MGKIFLLFGYKSFLTITECSDIQNITRIQIKKLTKLVKESKSKQLTYIYKSRKKRLARIISKMEHLFPEESVLSGKFESCKVCSEKEDCEKGQIEHCDLYSDYMNKHPEEDV